MRSTTATGLWPGAIRRASGSSLARATTGRSAIYWWRRNEHLEHPEGAVVFRHACKMGLELSLLADDTQGRSNLVRGSTSMAKFPITCASPHIGAPKNM